MSNSDRSKQANTEVFRIVLGNTDRSAEEVISQLRHTVRELAGVHIELAKNAPRLVGQLILDVYAPLGRVDAGTLRRVLNENGECMFQVDSIEKISQ